MAEPASSLNDWMPVSQHLARPFLLATASLLTTSNMSLFSLGRVLRGRYKVMHCISRGHQNTSPVWLVYDQSRVVSFPFDPGPALLVRPRLSQYRSMKVRTGARAVPPCGCPNEASSLRSTPDPDHPGYAVLPQVFDEFNVEAEDGRGRYECMVSTLCGPSLLTLCFPNRASLPWAIVKQTALCLSLALDYLHRVQGIIHGGEHSSAADAFEFRFMRLGSLRPQNEQHPHSTSREPGARR